MRLTRIPASRPGLQRIAGGQLQWTACWPIVDDRVPLLALLEEAKEKLVEQMRARSLAPTGRLRWYLCDMPDGQDLYAVVPVRRTARAAAA